MSELTVLFSGFYLQLNGDRGMNCVRKMLWEIDMFLQYIHALSFAVMEVQSPTISYLSSPSKPFPELVTGFYSKYMI